MYVEVYVMVWVPVEARRAGQVSIFEHRVPVDTPSLVWQTAFCRPVSTTSHHMWLSYL